MFDGAEIKAGLSGCDTLRWEVMSRLWQLKVIFKDGAQDDKASAAAAAALS